VIHGFILIALEDNDDLIVLDGDGIGADADCGASERAAGGDIEFPAMPWAGKDFSVAHPDMFPARCHIADHCAISSAFAEWAEGMRADIWQRIKRAVNIENADLDIANFHYPMRVLGELRYRPNDMGSHASLRS